MFHRFGSGLALACLALFGCGESENTADSGKKKTEPEKIPAVWRASLDAADFVSCNIFVSKDGVEQMVGCFNAGSESAAEMQRQCVPDEFSQVTQVSRVEYRTAGCPSREAWAACDFLASILIFYPVAKERSAEMEAACRGKGGRWYVL